MSRSPDLYEVIQAGIDLALSDVHTCMPGKVTSYDNATQLAEVQPTVKRRIKKDDGTEEAVEFPPIKNVPVVFPRAGKAFISFPIKQDDFVLLVFAERSIDQWFEKGGVQDPIVTTTFQLADAFAIAGIAPKNGKLSNANADDIVVGFDDGTRSHFKSGEVHLGKDNPSEFVALATKTKNEIKALRDSFNDFILNNYTGHMHPSGMGPTGPPVPAPPVIPPAPVGDVAASKVKAE